MSVLVPDDKVYNYIHNGLELAAYRSVCDEFYSSSVRQYFQHFDIHKESRRLVISWLNLNERSHVAAYRGEDKDYTSAIKYSLVSVQSYQLLKFLHCVQYNIELETITDALESGISEQQQKDYALLKTWIEELTSAIISQIPEYEKAKWCEAVS